LERNPVAPTVARLTVQNAGMAKNKHKRIPKTVLKLPDLGRSKLAVLNSLTSVSSQRPDDHAIREFIECYCSEPRLAFNKTVVTRYRISLEQAQYAPSTINLRLAAVGRLAYEAADSGLLRPDLAAGIRRVKGAKEQACSKRGVADVAPRDPRRTCARLCHEAGGELEQIHFLLGHVSVQTTERYLGCKPRLRNAGNDCIGLEPDQS